MTRPVRGRRPRRAAALVLVGLVVVLARVGPGASGGPTAPGPPCDVLVWIPAGPFWMGSADGDPEGGPDERPRRRVHLDGYAIDVYEVTNGCYARFLGAGGSRSPRAWSPEGWAWRSRRGVERPAYWGDPALGVPDAPVVGVSWFEADAYCRWRGGRLPTEAEWEKAARGEGGRRYPWGEAWDPARANGDVAVGRIQPVGRYPDGASPYGVLDLAGNVWEWVQDRYDPAANAAASATNPTGPEGGLTRVLRGGAWNFPPRQLRAAARTHLPPETRLRYLGFRCARP